MAFLPTHDTVPNLWRRLVLRLSAGVRVSSGRRLASCSTPQRSQASSCHPLALRASIVVGRARKSPARCLDHAESVPGRRAGQECFRWV